jgi:hypothetical protein
MKNFRSIIILALLALVLAAVPAAFAQDGTFGLSEDDLALWTSANEALASTSANMEFTVKLTANGVGEDGGDVTADISGVGAFDTTDPQNPLLWLDVTGTADGEPVSLNLRIVDGKAYMNSGDGWTFEELDDVASEITGELGDMGDMGDVDPSSLSPASAMDALSGFEQYISVTRTDDGGVAQFALSIDIPALLSSPEIGGMIAGLSGMGGSGEMTEAQMTQMSQMIGMMFADASVTFTEWIDIETETFNRAVMDVNFPLETILGTPGAGIVLTFDISVSGYGEPVTVEVPEGAVEASS